MSAPCHARGPPIVSQAWPGTRPAALAGVHSRPFRHPTPLSPSPHAVPIRSPSRLRSDLVKLVNPPDGVPGLIHTVDPSLGHGHATPITHMSIWNMSVLITQLPARPVLASLECHHVSPLCIGHLVHHVLHSQLHACVPVGGCDTPGTPCWTGSGSAGAHPLPCCCCLAGCCCALGQGCSHRRRIPRRVQSDGH